MEKSPLLQKALWSNVLFAELSAIAFFFFGSTFTFIDELAGGQRLICGIEFLVMAGLATYAALRPATSGRLIRGIVGLNVLLFGYFVHRLIWGPTVSGIATEILLIDTGVLAGLVVTQIMGLRAASFRKKSVRLA